MEHSWIKIDTIGLNPMWVECKNCKQKALWDSLTRSFLGASDKCINEKLRDENLNIENLYKGMQERLKHLEDQEQSEEIKWRIAEITLAIVKVQQLLLANVIK